MRLPHPFALQLKEPGCTAQQHLMRLKRLDQSQRLTARIVLVLLEHQFCISILQFSLALGQPPQARSVEHWLQEDPLVDQPGEHGDRHTFGPQDFLLTELHCTSEWVTKQKILSGGMAIDFGPVGALAHLIVLSQANKWWLMRLRKEITTTFASSLLVFSSSNFSCWFWPCSVDSMRNPYWTFNYELAAVPGFTCVLSRFSLTQLRWGIVSVNAKVML